MHLQPVLLIHLFGLNVPMEPGIFGSTGKKQQGLRPVRTHLPEAKEAPLPLQLNLFRQKPARWRF